jgi:hypothetical protein
VAALTPAAPYYQGCELARQPPDCQARTRRSASSCDGFWVHSVFGHLIHPPDLRLFVLSQDAGVQVALGHEPIGRGGMPVSPFHPGHGELVRCDARLSTVSGRPGRDETVLIGENHGLHPIAQAELGQHSGHMSLDRGLGDGQ